MKKSFYIYFFAVFLSLNAYALHAMEERKPSQTSNVPINNPQPVTIDYVYSGEMPLINRIAEFENGDDKPDSIVLNLRPEGQSYNASIIVFERDPQNRNQFIGFNTDEQADLIVNGEVPKNLTPYINPVVQSNPALGQNPPQQSTAFNNIPNSASSRIGEMGREMRARDDMIRRHTPPLNRDEVFVMVADNFYDEEVLPKIRNMCISERKLPLYNQAINKLSQNPELAYEKEQWPNNTQRYIPRHKKITAETIEEALYLSAYTRRKLEEIKANHKNDAFVQKYISRHIESHIKKRKPIKQIAYYLIDNMYAIPSSNQSKATIYNALFDINLGIPSFFYYNDIIKNEIMPGDIGQASSELRKLLFDVAFLKEHEIVINQKGLFKDTVEYAIACISTGNVYPEKSKSCAQIARSLYQALTDRTASKAILRCPEFDDIVLGDEKVYLHHMTLDRVADVLKELEKKDHSTFKQAELEKSLLTLNILWQRSRDNVRDAKALISCMSDVEDVVEIAKRLERSDEEIYLLLNQKIASYEPIEIKHERKTEPKDEEIFQEVAAIVKEQGHSGKMHPKPFQALDLPYVNDVRLVHDFALSSAQFGILSCELQKQGHPKLAQLAQDIGYGLFVAGRIVGEEAVDIAKDMGYTALGIGQFGLDAVKDPAKAWFKTADALEKCYQAAGDSMAKLGNFMEMFLFDEEQFFKMLREASDDTYDYVSNLPPEEIFRSSVRLALDYVSFRTRLLKTIPVCCKAMYGLTKQAEKVRRTLKNKKALAIAFKCFKDQKRLRLYKKVVKVAKSGAGKSYGRATEEAIEALAELKAYRLSLKYSASAVQEACKVLGLERIQVVRKTKNPFKLIEEMARDIAKIDSKPRWNGLRFDPAHGGKCGLKNVREAIAGLACEEQGLLQVLTREVSGKHEFIDKAGKFWDVKSPTSYALDGMKVFNTKVGIKEFTESLREAILNLNENFIIDLTHLHASDHPTLYNILKQLPANDLKRMLIVDAINPKNSKTTIELLNFLGY